MVILKCRLKAGGLIATFKKLTRGEKRKISKELPIAALMFSEK